MEEYPLQYTAHNYPLVVLSGLAQPTTKEDDVISSRGPLIKAQLPLVKSERREELLQEFLAAEGSDKSWSSRTARSKAGLIGYRFQVVGRVYLADMLCVISTDFQQKYRLPVRKSDPPSPAELQRENPLEEPQDRPSQPWVLHSPLSPLSPGSSLYPDGIFTPQWLDKHQHRVPALTLFFFDFTSDSNLNSLNDNQLKSEISSIRAAITSSEYKIRFAIVLLSDKTIGEAPDIEERLGNIRRATGLDPKSGLFFLPPNISKVEVSSFAISVLTTLQPTCIEYYRDLTKHARRKKNRGNVPPPTIPPTRTTSQALLSYGWNIRYDIKMAVFAEFRQEMDAACRHYTSALESLMGSEGVFETTAIWSPRWNEARTLGDMMAFRIIRCLLWTQLATTAAQSYVNYRDRMRELIDRKGKGTNNYGWEAWESRWSKMMGQLIQKADIPEISITESVDLSASAVTARSANPVYIPPEKSYPIGERFPPFYHLHHPGYWYRLSARHAKRRRRYALEIPEEDRPPPGRSPASATAKRADTYDTFMTPEPHSEYPLESNDGFDHMADIVGKLDVAARSFTERKQKRFADRLHFEMAHEYMRKGQHDQALRILKLLWTNTSWRSERWYLPLFELTRSLCETAKAADDLATLVATTFELHSQHLRLIRDLNIDLMSLRTESKDANTDGKPTIEVSPHNITSCLATSFSFGNQEGNVGEGAFAQLLVASNAHQQTAPLILSRIRGKLKPDRYSFDLRHQAKKENESEPETVTPGTLSLVDLTKKMVPENLDDTRIEFRAETDMVFPPSRRTVWDLRFDIKDPGEIELDSLEIEIETISFLLRYTVKPDWFQSPISRFTQGLKGIKERRILRETPWTIEIKPKPPKLELGIARLAVAFYTDEQVKLDFLISNGEDEEVEPTIDTRLIGERAPAIRWAERETTEQPEEEPSAGAAKPLLLSSLGPNKSSKYVAKFKAPSIPSTFQLESKLHYTLPSDRQVPLSKYHSATINVVSPFEANYDFSAQIHPDPWPSFFSADEPIPGLTQRWALIVRLASFASESLKVKKVEVKFEDNAKISRSRVGLEETVAEAELEPGMMRSYTFSVDTTRVPHSSSKDPRSTSLHGKLLVTWSRLDACSEEFTSTLPLPPLSMPALEPRIIATAKHMELDAPVGSDPSFPSTPLTILTLTLENPTMHPLTFDITAPPSDSLAFSGPKQQSITSLPYSRMEVQFRLLALVPSGATATFDLKVQDRYFIRDVAILPENGVRLSEDGGLRWQVP